MNEVRSGKDELRTDELEVAQDPTVVEDRDATDIVVAINDP